MRDKSTPLPLFSGSTFSVTRARNIRREDGKTAEGPHMLHLRVVPLWQNGNRHMKLKTGMQDSDRSDLIESELSRAGLAFDSAQPEQVFRGVDLAILFSQNPPTPIRNETLRVSIDQVTGVLGSDCSSMSANRGS